MDLLADTSDAGKAMSWMLHCPQSDFEANLDHKNFENVVVLRDPLRFIITLKKGDIKPNVEKLFGTSMIPFVNLHPFDLFDCEALQWDPPGYSRLSLCLKAVNAGNFAELFRLLPVLRDEDEEDLQEWVDDGLMESILTSGISKNLPLEDCHHIFSDRYEPSGCKCESKEVAYVCGDCGQCFCEKCRNAIRKVQRTKPYMDTLFVREKAKKIRGDSSASSFEQLGSGPAYVKRGRMSSERKVQWVEHRIAALKLPKLTPNAESFVDFYKVFKEVSTYTGVNKDTDAQHLAIAAFKTLTGFEVTVKSLPPDVRAEVESVTSGKLVERCEKCGNKTCNCLNKWPDICEVCHKTYVMCTGDGDKSGPECVFQGCAHCWKALGEAFTKENLLKFHVSCRCCSYFPYEERLAHHIKRTGYAPEAPEPPPKRQRKNQK